MISKGSVDTAGVAILVVDVDVDVDVVDNVAWVICVDIAVVVFVVVEAEVVVGGVVEVEEGEGDEEPFTFGGFG